MNSRESIKAEFTYLDKRIEEEMTVYLLGGGAMTFRGLKNATYDLDLLVTTHQDFELLRDLLLERGYNFVENPTVEYKALGAAALLDKDGACRFDIFDRKVIKKLSLSRGMKERAKKVFVGSKLNVNALSNEDVFLFKGVAGRTRDITDMIRLVETEQGLSFDVIIEEFQNQLPINKSEEEKDILNDTPESHPVIAFERALESLPMTLPKSFMDQIEQEGDRVYAEFEIMNNIMEQKTINDLTELLISKKTVNVHSRADVKMVIDSLVDKELVKFDGENIKKF